MAGRLTIGIWEWVEVHRTRGVAAHPWTHPVIAICSRIRESVAFLAIRTEMLRGRVGVTGTGMTEVKLLL